MEKPITDQIRSACRRVAAEAEFVRIDRDRIKEYARSLPAVSPDAAGHDPEYHYLGRGDDTAAFFVMLNTVNFGSGYFPGLKKRPGRSGYWAVAGGLKNYFDVFGPFTAEQLQVLTAADCRRIFGQTPEDPAVQELMALYAEAFNDLGDFLIGNFNGSCTEMIRRAAGSAERLIELLAEMPFFQDVAVYRSATVPFYKRGQLMAADLSLAFDGRSWGAFHDLECLTIFADNLVPHVLRVDRILVYHESLQARIQAGELIPSGAPEEVEIRACAVHAVELIRRALDDRGIQAPAARIDTALWTRGQQPSYKAVPRHRTRCVFY